METFADDRCASEAKARSLVCEHCWSLFVNTAKYERVCMYNDPYLDEPATYEIQVNQLSSSTNCSWCSLIQTSFNRDLVSKPPHSSGNIKVSFSGGLDSVNPKDGRNAFVVGANQDGQLSSRFAFLAFTSDEDRAAPHVTARPVRMDMHIEAIKGEIQDWLDRCSGHDCCSQPGETFLPTRVIELNPSEDPEHIRLVESHDRTGRYAALSYCWGIPSRYILTRTAHQQYLSRIPWPKLPQTIKDAVLVARATNVQYLWVDAFCIIQDDTDDKIREIACMCDIYSRSDFTIVAAIADDALKGFLQQRTHHGETFTVPFRITEGNYGTMSLQYYDDHIEMEAMDPIQQRAWTLQEQILSQRVLYFGSRTLEWRCGVGRKLLGVNTLGLDRWETHLEYGLLSSILSPWSQDPQDILSLWLDIVRNYSLRKTSSEGDRLLALAGIAQIFSNSLGPAYYAGLWQFDTLRQLNWHRPRGTQAASSKSYCAPSWSWASSLGNISFFYLQSTVPVDFLHVECSLVAHELPYGAVSNGSITLRGGHARGYLHCQRITMDHFIELKGLKEWDIPKGSDLDSEEPRKIDNSAPNPPAILEFLPDTVEEISTSPRNVLCLRTNCISYSGPTTTCGLVLEQVPRLTTTFRRIGYFYEDSETLTEIKKRVFPGWDIKRSRYEPWIEIELTII